MDLFFLTSSVFSSQEGSQRGLGCVLSLSLSLRVGGLPGRDCIETRAALFSPSPFLKLIINRCLEVLF